MMLIWPYLSDADTDIHDVDGYSAILQQVVTINQNRILCRLRSKHAILRCQYKTQKMRRPSWLPRLCNSIGDVEGNTEGIHQLIPHRNRLMSLFNVLESLSSHEARTATGKDLLVEIIHACSCLSYEAALRNAIPGSVDSCVLAMKKVSRYLQLSKRLARYAMRLSPLGSVQISVVKYDAAQSSILEVGSSIDGTLGRIDKVLLENRIDARAKQISNMDFKGHIAQTNVLRYPVHAEMQLLFHYEERAIRRPPRVICSNKQACFLCNLFFCVHRKFIIPNTHGRLYEKWAFPAVLSDPGHRVSVQLSETLQQFSEEIENRIKEEINRRGQTLPMPCESALLLTGTASNQSVSSRSNMRLQHHGKGLLGYDPKPDDLNHAQQQSHQVAGRNSLFMRTKADPGSVSECNKTVKLQQGLLTTSSSVEESLVAYTANTNFLVFHDIYGDMSNLGEEKIKYPTRSMNMKVQFQWLEITRDMFSYNINGNRLIVDVSALPENTDVTVGFTHESWPRQLWLRRNSDIVILNYKSN